jgi:ribosomal protein L22
MAARRRSDAEEPQAQDEQAPAEVEPEAEDEAVEEQAKPKPARRRRSRARAAEEVDEAAATAEPESAVEDEATEEPEDQAEREGEAEAESEDEEPYDEEEDELGAYPYERSVRVVRAQARYVRSSARKARLVCDHLRGKSVDEARAILAFNPRGVARDWSKVLESAVANAENNHELVSEDLVIREAFADEGPTIKRFQPRARGRATPIRKRTSHLTITLAPDWR